MNPMRTEPYRNSDASVTETEVLTLQLGLGLELGLGLGLGLGRGFNPLACTEALILSYGSNLNP